MDFATRILEAGWAFNREEVVEKAAEVLSTARSAGIPVIHIVPGGVDPGTNPASAIDRGVAAKDDEMVFAKRRVGAFSTTGLDAHLRSIGRDTLVLMGIATSGVVLSTHRWANDTGYKLVVIKDACSDRDRDVHRALTDDPENKSYLAYIHQGMVLTAQEFASLVK